MASESQGQSWVTQLRVRKEDGGSTLRIQGRRMGEYPENTRTKDPHVSEWVSKSLPSEQWNLIPRHMSCHVTNRLDFSCALTWCSCVGHSLCKPKLIHSWNQHEGSKPQRSKCSSVSVCWQQSPTAIMAKAICMLTSYWLLLNLLSFWLVTYAIPTPSPEEVKL